MESSLTPMERWALDTVTEIFDMKEGVVPRAAHISELRNAFNVELTEALRSLCRRGVLGVRLDINKNPMFHLENRESDE